MTVSKGPQIIWNERRPWGTENKAQESFNQNERKCSEIFVKFERNPLKNGQPNLYRDDNQDYLKAEDISVQEAIHLFRYRVKIANFKENSVQKSGIKDVLSVLST